MSDLILIFIGIFLFEYFKNLLTNNIELIFNILLFIFLVYFIISKLRFKYESLDLNLKENKISLKNVVVKP